MDHEFAHARLFLKRDQRHAMSHSLMSFLRRAKAGPMSHASAEGRLEKVSKGSIKSMFTQANMHAGLTREQEIQLRLDRVEEWLMQVQKCNEGAREVKFY
jgi:uncharacterized protein involved in copper resistance